MNSKAEFNRCKIQRIETRFDKSLWDETVAENETDEMVKREMKLLQTKKRSRKTEKTVLKKTERKLKEECIRLKNENYRILYC